MPDPVQAAADTTAAPAAPAPAAPPVATEALQAVAAEPGAAATAPQPSAAPAPDAPKAAEPAPAEPKPEPSLLEAAASKSKAEKPPESPAPKAGDPPAPEAAKPKDDKAEPAKDAKALEGKPAEKPADDAAKPDPAKDATAQGEPPAPVKYDAFKVPDGIKLDDKEIGRFAEIIGPAQVKQEVAQQLVDLYVQDMQRVVNERDRHQREVWRGYIDGWKSDLRKDPELGGNRLETSLSIAKAVVEEYGGSADQQKELWRLLGEREGNGMGNNVHLVRLLHNLGVAMNVFEDKMVPANATPPKPAKGPGNRGWYGPVA